MNKKLKFFIGVFIGSSTLSYAETVSSGNANKKPMEISGSVPAQVKPPAPKKPAATRSVFLNDVNINSVRNQELDNVSVQIDKKGNIYIEAPQYEVTADTSARAPAPKKDSSPARTAQNDTERTAKDGSEPQAKGRFSPEPEKSVDLDEVDENEPVIYKPDGR